MTKTKTLGPETARGISPMECDPAEAGPRGGGRWLVTTLAFLAIGLTSTVASAQKLVFVVRHAERADSGASGMQASDPPLSAAGAARAAKLAVMLANAGIKAVDVTEFKRSQDTGQPLASKLGLTLERGPSADVNGLVARLRRQHANDIVLVIGHSNTVPAIIKALGGPDVTIGDDEYDNLFVIVPGTGILTRIRF